MFYLWRLSSKSNRILTPIFKDGSIPALSLPPQATVAGRVEVGQERWLPIRKLRLGEAENLASVPC